MQPRTWALALALALAPLAPRARALALAPTVLGAPRKTLAVDAAAQVRALAPGGGVRRAEFGGSKNTDSPWHLGSRQYANAPCGLDNGNVRQFATDNVLFVFCFVLKIGSF